MYACAPIDRGVARDCSKNKSDEKRADGKVREGRVSV